MVRGAQVAQSCRLIGMTATVGPAAPRPEDCDFAIVGVEEAPAALRCAFLSIAFQNLSLLLLRPRYSIVSLVSFLLPLFTLIVILTIVNIVVVVMFVVICSIFYSLVIHTQ